MAKRTVKRTIKLPRKSKGRVSRSKMRRAVTVARSSKTGRFVSTKSKSK